MQLQFVPILLGVLGLAIALIVYSVIAKLKVSNEKVASIGGQIHIGAMAFMRREYTIMAIFLAVLAILIAISGLGLKTMIAFLLGAFCSAFAFPKMNELKIGRREGRCLRITTSLRYFFSNLCFKRAINVDFPAPSTPLSVRVKESLRITFRMLSARYDS